MNALLRTEKRQRVAGIINAETELGMIMKLADERNEHAVIGAVLQAPEVYPTLSEIIQAADFFFLENGFIWHAIDTLSGRGEVPDIVNLPSFMETLPGCMLQGAALEAKLADMMAACPDYDHAEQYARRVFESSLRIRMIRASKDIEAQAMDKTKTIDDVIASSDHLLYNATNRMIEKRTDALGIVDAYYAKVEKMLNEGRTVGTPYGYAELDKLITAYPGEVTIVAGTEGMGKTTWLVSTMRNQVKGGMNAVLFSLEMSQEEVIRKFIAMESGLYPDNLKEFKIGKVEWGKFVEASGTISKWGLDVIDDYPTLSPVQLRRKLRKMLLEKTIDSVFIDGLWLMEASEPSGDRPKDVAMIMRDLNIIARDFTVPIIVAHQYNANAANRGDHTPTIFDLAESAGVRRNAQVIIGLYRHSYYEQDSVDTVTKGYILKDRNGRATGKIVKFGYNERYSRYEDGQNVDLNK